MNTPRPWLPHLVCLALLLAQGAAWAVLHRSNDELERDAVQGDPQARIAALHILTNRDEPAAERFDFDFATSLIESDEPLLREYAYTTDICKHAEPRVQYTELKALAERPSDPEFWRTFVFHRRKVGVLLGGSSARLRLAEFHWYRDALAGRELPGEELLTHIEGTP